jgi:L-histidine N-alpha-methyltransferase
VDVSESALRAAGAAVAAEYPGLDVHAVVSDFDAYLGLEAAGSGDGPQPHPGGRPPRSASPGGVPRTPGPPGDRLVAFLGSTIGNMMPPERARFLSRVRSALRPGDTFLLGTDLVKDPAVLIAAYDDSAGVTSAFNKNVLSVLNDSLGADFDLDAFDHVVVWDAESEWIEMRLRSAADQEIPVPGVELTVPFGAGEEMRTEVSAKFRRAGVAAELAAAGFEMRSWWTDEAGQFGLSLSVPV